MLKRLSDNTNIRLHTDNKYMGLTVLNRQGPLSEPYLERIRNTIYKAIGQHPRTFAIRFDLTVPLHMTVIDTVIISRFLASLRAQVEADLCSKAKKRSRIYPCRIRYIWAREQNVSHNWHYHCVIFLNKDIYCAVGNYKAKKGNMAAKIHKAWASALGIDISDARGLVEFCAVFILDRNDLSNEMNLDPLFEACSYLAKVATKQFGDRTKNFSSSNL